MKKMNEGVNEALKDPAVVELFAKSGASPNVTTLDQAMKQVKDEVSTYAKIVAQSGIKFE
jgi:tripartite-type tricarboxylate transporter receptor subunit TctC